VSIVAVEVVATIRANDVAGVGTGVGAGVGAGVGTGVGAGVGAHGDLADVELEAFTYIIESGSFSLSGSREIKLAHEPLNTLIDSAPVALNMVAFSLGGEQDVAVQGAPDVLNGSSQSCVSHI